MFEIAFGFVCFNTDSSSLLTSRVTGNGVAVIYLFPSHQIALNLVWRAVIRLLNLRNNLTTINFIPVQASEMSVFHLPRFSALFKPVRKSQELKN